MFYILTLKILSESNSNLTFARNHLKVIEDSLAINPEDLTSIEIMNCERDINQLSDIIEDQYVGFEIIASLYPNDPKKENIQSTRSLIKGFEPLNKAMLRLEKKAESLRLQFMLYQQEKSTRKINLLTIIQAVFVPLTFIAGVYGMNFINMPELEWPHGYLFIWILFIAMSSGLM